MAGPFNRNWSRYAKVRGQSRPCETFSQTWRTSPRIAGVLQLRPQEFSLSHEGNISHSERSSPQWAAPVVPLYGHVASSAFESHMSGARKRAVSAFYSELKGNNAASLGMTVASWQQSWSMIRKRYGQIHVFAIAAARKSRTETKSLTTAFKIDLRSLDKAMADLHFRIHAASSREDLWRKPADLRRLKRLLRRKQRERDLRWVRYKRDLQKASSANIFLEGVFGWMPLLTDIINAAKTLTGNNFPAGYISGIGKGEGSLPPDPYVPGRRQLVSATGMCRSKLTAQVSVSNPNVWLANQLGLLNPSVILWDKIPWSWVVNMFVNVNQVLEGFTATWGLKVEYISRTDQTRIVSSVRQDTSYPQSHPGYAVSTSSSFGRFKTRELMSGLPTPQLQLRLPKGNMTLGLIAASIVGQKIGKFSRNQDN